ncbi:hypothetical protein [Lutibacter sp.]
MFKGLLKHIKFGNTYGAVEHQSSEGQNSIRLLLLKKKQTAFEIEKSTLLNEIQQVVNSTSKSQHLFLTINNNQVLSKIIPKELSNAKAVKISYTNIIINDFYYDILQLEQHTYVAICRKEVVDILLKSYQKFQINIIGFSLGNSSLKNLLPFIESGEFQTGNTKFSTNKGKLTSLVSYKSNIKKQYPINGLNISNSEMLGLASTIGYFSGLDSTNTNYRQENESLLKGYIQNNIFINGLKLGLGILLTTLLINFFLFNYYTERNVALSQSTKLGQVTKEKFLKLNEGLLHKKKLAHQIVNLSSSKIAYYLDQIGISLPTTATLKTLMYQPILKKVENQKKLLLDEHIIIVKGISLNSDDYSKWINDLEAMDWVKSIEIINYGLQKSKKTSFHIKVVMQ